MPLEVDHTATDSGSSGDAAATAAEGERREPSWVAHALARRREGEWRELAERVRAGVGVGVGVDAKLVAQVRMDVPRSFGGAEVERGKRDALEEVLLVAGTYQHGKGYTQGQGLVVSFALQGVGFDEPHREAAFWLLVLVSERVPRNFFTTAALDEIFVFGSIVARFCPSLKSRLGSDFEPAMGFVVPRWLLSLFAYCLPGGVTQAVWQEVLFPPLAAASSQTLTENHREEEEEEDPEPLATGLYRVALALVELHSAKLLSEERRRGSGAGSAEQLSPMEFVQRIVDNAAQDTRVAPLLGLVRQSPVTARVVRSARAALARRRAAEARAAMRIQMWYRVWRRRRQQQQQQQRRSAPSTPPPQSAAPSTTPSNVTALLRTLSCGVAVSGR